jgi:KDO2-lipid IV(A) lauroyltransferase
LFTKIPVLIIVKPQSNTYADLHLNKIRTRDGNSVISMYNAATGIIRTLKQGGIVAMLADQSATQDKDIYVDFFGRPAATYEAPASLALRYGSPILMAFAERQPDHTYKTRLIEVESSDLQNNKDGIAELTKRHVKLLEDAIRKNPGSWAWQHRRWKHSPTTD